MFDEQPDGDPHGECAVEIRRLERELANAKWLIAEAANQTPVGYQRIVNGRWEPCSAFVAVGFGEMPSDGTVRAVYAAPFPRAPAPALPAEAQP